MNAHSRNSWLDSLREPADGTEWPVLPVLAALLGCWLLLGWPWLSGRVTIPWDAKATFMPQIQFLAQSLAAGDSPFWNPYVFGGYPQIADPQSMIFSPVFLALAAVDRAPSLRAVDTAVLTGILVGAGALVLWFRDRGWHWAGALLAALGFGFGAAMAWRIQHTGQVLSMATLPVVMLLLDRAFARRSSGYGLAAGIAAGFMVLGRDQVALLNVYFLIAFVLWQIFEGGRASLRSMVKPLLLGGVGGLAVIAIPVLLTALFTADSNRPEIDFIGAGRGSLHPALLLTLFTPDLFGSSGEMANYWGPPSLTWTGTDLFIAQNVGQLYVGAIPALLIALGTATGALGSREIRFFTAAAAVMVIYALGWNTPIFRGFHAVLPGVDFYRRPADAVFEIGFLLAILAGYTAHRLLTFTLPPLTRWHALAVFGVIALAFVSGAGFATHFDRWPRATIPFSAAAVIFTCASAALAAAAWHYPLRPRLAAGLLIAFTVADLAYSNGPGSATALPPETYDALQPNSRNETLRILKEKVAATRSDTRRDRIELAGLGFHWPNVSITHKLENTLGYNPLRLALYSQATGAGDHIVTAADRKFAPLFPSYASPLADLLGLRYIASGAPIDTIDKTLKPEALNFVARTADAYIYENPGTFPRVLFATQALPADFNAILASGRWPDVDLTRTVLLDRVPQMTPPRPPGSARILDYRNTVVRISADSPAGGWVVLNDVWHPWWSAEIDGTPAPIERANVLFRAVRVAPGQHEVRFEFRPIRGALTELVSRIWK